MLNIFDSSLTIVSILTSFYQKFGFSLFIKPYLSDLQSSKTWKMYKTELYLLYSLSEKKSNLVTLPDMNTDLEVCKCPSPNGIGCCIGILRSWPFQAQALTYDIDKTSCLLFTSHRFSRETFISPWRISIVVELVWTQRSICCYGYAMANAAQKWKWDSSFMVKTIFLFLGSELARKINDAVRT